MSQIPLDTRLLNMTCLVQSNIGSLVSSGSAFFYSQLEDGFSGPINEEEQIGWKKVEQICLITNRHVLFPKMKDVDGKETERIPDSVVFFLRQINNQRIEWYPIVLNRDEVLKRTKVSSNPQIDLACVDIYDLVTDVAIKHPNIMSVGFLTNQDLPSNQPIKIETTSDIIVCSYPKCFYDTLNKYPIIKSGIIASGWRLHFKGNPTFLIDAKLFPGSSGGLVLSKPMDVAVINGQLMRNEQKQFVFLGVYSGEYFFNEKREDGTVHKEPYGLGIVWYSDLIPGIVNNGVTFV